MTLYMIGIGLHDEKDITLKGLEAVRRCSKVFLERYTSVICVDIEKMSAAWGVELAVADRKLVEKRSDEIILPAKDSDIAFLVAGDVFSATTHIDLMQRAREKGIDVRVINNASVLTAVGIVGLELYKYGRVVSIPFHTENVKSPVERFQKNLEAGLHTLFLLDLDPSSGRFLSGAKASLYLMENGVSGDTNAVLCAQLGSDRPFIRYGSLEGVSGSDVERYPQCIVVPGKLHFMEEEALSCLARME